MAARRIFVGDVQGCAEELEEMIERGRAAFGTQFELWLVGDLVNRGPHNLRGLRLVREWVEAGRAEYVLGNHELNLLRVAAGQRALSPFDSIGDVLDAPDADDWVDWLRRRPLARRGRIGGQRFVMVHAAVHPDWSLKKLMRRVRAAEERLGAHSRTDAEDFLAGDPSEDAALDTLLRVTCCRSVDARGRWSSAEPDLAPPGYRAWHEVWAERGHRYGIVYGHWAMQGLHVAPGLRGLDTGCVHHGRGRDGVLTAWVPDPDDETPFAPTEDDLWRVPARRAYYAHKESGLAGQTSADSD